MLNLRAVILLSFVVILTSFAPSKSNYQPVTRGVIGDGWADIVLGKPDFTGLAANEVTGSRLFNGGGVIVDRSVQPNRLYVYDGANSRVLGLDHLGTCSGGDKAGQECTTDSNCPQSSCDVEEGRSADLVIGQPDFSSSGCNGDSNFQNYPNRAPASASSLCGLMESQVSPLEGGSIANMAVDENGSLYVPDWDNHRVLLYFSPFETDTVADAVWGQNNFSDNECNEGRGEYAPDADSICLRSTYNQGFFGGVTLDTQKNLWITDNMNNRVLRFPYDPSTGIASHTPDLVLGQKDFFTGYRGSSLDHMSAPAAVRVGPTGSVYVADSLNNRILIFDPPLLSGMEASRLLGADVPFREPTSIEFDLEGNIWVSDRMNNQLLRFDHEGKIDKVLSKDVPDFSGACGGSFQGDGPNFYLSGEGRYIQSFVICDTPGSIGIDSDGNVFVYGINNWQDVWRFPAPFPSPQPGIAHSADQQIFKPFAFREFNHASERAMISPRGVITANEQIIIADMGRILFWNATAAELTNGQPADGYVAAPNPHEHPEPHFGKIDADEANHLYAIHGESIEVYSLPLLTGNEPFLQISNPLGCLDTSKTYMQLTRKADEATPSLGRSAPLNAGAGETNWGWKLHTGDIAATKDSKYLWITDSENSRILRVRDPLTHPTVDIVLGQENITGDQCNQGKPLPTEKTLCFPGHISLDEHGNLFVADHSLEARGNFRLLEFDAELFPDNPTDMIFGLSASRVYGTNMTFQQNTCNDLACGPWEPAFDFYGRMYIGYNGYEGSRLPHFYVDPLNETTPTGVLNDYYSMAYTTHVDKDNNLYIGDLNRGRVLIYFLGDPKNSYTISGSITNWRGKPVEQVSIDLKPTLWDSTSAADGTFSIDGMAPQTYELIPTKEGCTFYPSSRTVQVTSSNVQDQKFIGTCLKDLILYLPIFQN